MQENQVLLFAMFWYFFLHIFLIHAWIYTEVGDKEGRLYFHISNIITIKSLFYFRFLCITEINYVPHYLQIRVSC